MYLSMVPVDRTTHQHPNNDTPTDIPYMKNMDEISYWIYTKRAPCLMNYDNLIKKQSIEANNSNSKLKNVPNVVQEVPSLKKRKKRKPSSLSDDSLINDDIQKNIYFEAAQKQNHKTALSSDELGSNIDFDIKKSVQEKPTRSKLQKNSKTSLPKKNKMLTSTPKPMSLRRSLRKKQQNLNNGHINMSYEFNSSLVTGINLKHNNSLVNNTDDQSKEQCGILTAGDHSSDKKLSNTKVTLNNDVLNGQFEDLSDMSGFTANYIRSTKEQSKKTPRKLKCKTSKNLINESKHIEQKDVKMTVCINKTVNTRQSKNTLLNSSKESSQNVISVVTTKNNGTCSKVDEGTSLIKLLVPTETTVSIEDNKPKNKNLKNDNLQSTSRYPRRSKNPKANNTQTRNSSKQCNSEFNKSDSKENPQEQLTSRTRSGRSTGVTLFRPENSVIIFSNSSEHGSSVISLNVVRTNKRLKRKKCVIKKAINLQKSEKPRYSIRNKSGFGTCFSESDDDSVPLIRRFFCE